MITFPDQLVVPDSDYTVVGTWQGPRLFQPARLYIETRDEPNTETCAVLQVLADLYEQLCGKPVSWTQAPLWEQLETWQAWESSNLKAPSWPYPQPALWRRLLKRLPSKMPEWRHLYLRLDVESHVTARMGARRLEIVSARWGNIDEAGHFRGAMGFRGGEPPGFVVGAAVGSAIGGWITMNVGESAQVRVVDRGSPISYRARMRVSGWELSTDRQAGNL